MDNAGLDGGGHERREHVVSKQICRPTDDGQVKVGVSASSGAGSMVFAGVALKEPLTVRPRLRHRASSRSLRQHQRARSRPCASPGTTRTRPRRRRGRRR